VRATWGTRTPSPCSCLFWHLSFCTWCWVPRCFWSASWRSYAVVLGLSKSPQLLHDATPKPLNSRWWRFAWVCLEYCTQYPQPVWWQACSTSIGRVTNGLWLHQCLLTNLGQVCGSSCWDFSCLSSSEWRRQYGFGRPKHYELGNVCSTAWALTSSLQWSATPYNITHLHLNLFHHPSRGLSMDTRHRENIANMAVRRLCDTIKT
jgi:hypothetical protein